MAAIHLEDLSQTYGSVAALKGVDLEIREGEFFSLLGPSGSGKTTLLRLIAGFEPPVSGSIRIGEKVVTHLPPERREVGIVFQNYALFPHLNVFDNVAYGLRSRKKSKAEIGERVGETLALVELEEYGDRAVHELSGGQQQRVALARAVAPRPRVLLMDEPLSNLDARLRLHTRRQLHDLQRRIGMTTVYVTHDQSEAFALSERLAVLLEGNVVAVGTPSDVYRNPKTVEAADFLGEMNFFARSAETGIEAGSGRVDLFGKPVEIPLGNFNFPEGEGTKCRVGIRPEAFGPKGLFTEETEVRVESVLYEGNVWRMECSREGERLSINWPAPLLEQAPERGSRITISFNASEARIFPAK